MTTIIKIMLAGFFLTACQQSKQHHQNIISEVFSLPKKLKEVSGITYNAKKDILYTIEDSGNENTVYGLNAKGNITEEITIEGVENIDWEDITSDENGNLYIGDFGNNANERKDLAIYKVPANDVENKKTTAVEKISFYYPEQTDFPPKKYDVEAFLFYKNSFYLFTKNRSKNFDGTTLLYKVPNITGKHAATLIGSYKTGEDYNNGAITAAAMSPDETKIVILSHSKLWLFENFHNDTFLNGTITKIDLQHNSQKEAVTFKDDTTLLIADEKIKKSGGNVYSYTLPH
jgi:hypothetical protein